MAFTVTTIDKTVMGDKRVVTLACLADAATAEIDTGLSAVDFIQVTYKSMTSGAPKFRLNVGVTSTAAVGSIAVTGVTSGDEFWVTCYGR